LSTFAMDNFRRLADTIAADISEGRLRGGERLPTQRDFAFKNGIAVSTASRVYSELARRGLVVGEVGRGSFIRALPSTLSLSEPHRGLIDLEYNFPILQAQQSLVATTLEAVIRSDSLGRSMLAVNVGGSRIVRETVASFLANGSWRPDPDGVLFTGNGRQAIASALSASATVGGRIGVEALTYPVVKGIVSRLGLIAVPVTMDQSGMRPDAIALAHRNSPLRAIYIQPHLQNPLGISMSDARCTEIAEILHRHDLVAIEDAVYSFLLGERVPLAAYAPARTILVESLSKRLSPGLTLGMIVAPPGPIFERLSTAIRLGAWTPCGFALEFGYHWLKSGAAAVIEEAKRRDAVDRQKIASQALDGLSFAGDRRSYHVWLELPDRWRAETFVSAAARHGIAITPAAAFAAVPGHAPNAVRLALASPALNDLSEALKTIAKIYNGEPDATSAH
jgi:DNA-binding transcriptional MocR family regulator